MFGLLCKAEKYKKKIENVVTNIATFEATVYTQNIKPMLWNLPKNCVFKISDVEFSTKYGTYKNTCSERKEQEKINFVYSMVEMVLILFIF